ncbi:MAG: F0F1 ATP synthase subunit delta [Gemmatimonadota bacterium]|nr:F0F1 ATP synthase subunit delta [Gemmatimonadota bacterium]
MREPTIARNYAETLVELARRGGDLKGWGAMISEVADAIRNDDRLLRFLQAPRVSAMRKNEILAKAFQDRLPRVFVRFLQAVISHRRQTLIPQIAEQYHALVDEIEGRVHASVILAREPDPETRSQVERRLAEVLGKEVVAHFSVNASIIGGVIIRVGDSVRDGSVRRKLQMLRRQMLLGAAAR